MSNVFNTLLEVSLRSLLVLSTSNRKSTSTDMIAAVDFITVYGKDFGIASTNLHGDNSFKFSELAIRRDAVNKAVKKLVLEGFLRVFVNQSGFEYAINDHGNKYCSKLESDYSEEYRILASMAWTFVADRSERDIMELINRYSIISIK